MKTLSRAARNDALLIDVVACTAIGGALLVLGSTYKYERFPEHLMAIRDGLYQLEALVIAAILGFLIAAAAILAAASGVQRLRAERYDVYKLLVRSFTTSMTMAVISLVYSVAAYISDQDKNSAPTFVLIGFVLFLIVILRIARAVRRLYQSLSI